MPLSDVGKMNEQKTGSSNWIVADPPARDYGEARFLDGVQHFGPEHHVVIAGDQALNPSPGKLGDELVVLIGAEKAGGKLPQRDDLDVQHVLVDRLAEDGLGEVLVQREGRSARRLYGGCVRAAPRGRWPRRRSGASAWGRAR